MLPILFPNKKISGKLKFRRKRNISQKKCFASKKNWPKKFCKTILLPKKFLSKQMLPKKFLSETKNFAEPKFQQKKFHNKTSAKK